MKTIISLLTFIPFILSAVTFVYLFIVSYDEPLVSILAANQFVVSFILLNFSSDIYRAIEHFIWLLKNGMKDE